MYLASNAFCSAGVQHNLMCPAASEGSHLFKLSHHSIDRLHALKSPVDISGLHFSGASEAGTRGCGGCCAGLWLREAMAGTSASRISWAFTDVCGNVLLAFWRPLRELASDLSGGMADYCDPADCAI